MIKIRWGLGGLFVLWVIAMALWAAVGLARSARGETLVAPPAATSTTALSNPDCPATPLLSRKSPPRRSHPPAGCSGSRPFAAGW